MWSAIFYLFKYFCKLKVHYTLFLGVGVLLYCVIASDFSSGLKIGYLIYPILLFLMMFVCIDADHSEYKNLIQVFTIGFILSAVIGLFKDNIPSMAKIFESNPLYIQGVEETFGIERYSGLSYDPNFFALLDCVLIAIIVYTNPKFSIVSIAQLVFLITIGFFTFSKSYILMLFIIVIPYIIKEFGRLYKVVFFFSILILCLVIVERFTQLEVLTLIKARFDSADGANDLTTGRLDIWKYYFDHITDSLKILMFGKGFNAPALGKAAHNTYIDYIYRFGLIGTALWLIYFTMCFKIVKVDKKDNYNGSIFPLIILSVGIFFLSAFHFQQLWCCIMLCLLSKNILGEDIEDAEYYCTDL